MNPRILALAVFASAAACVAPNAAPIQIGNVFLVDGQDGVCGPTDTQIVGGSLDVSGAQVTNALTYLLGLQVDNLMQDEEVQQSGTAVHTTQNTVTIDTILVSYSSEPAFTFEADRIPIHFAVKPGSSSNKATVRVIGPRAAAVLANSVAPNDQATLKVRIQASGATLSGNRVTSNAIEFPIRVFNSGFTGCVAPDRLILDAPCGNVGQNGAPRCCSQDPTNEACKT